MTSAHAALVAHLLEHSVRTGDFTLKSGKRSSWFIDAKQTTCRADGMLLVADAALEVLPDDVTAIGGLTMGADAFAIGVAVEAGCKWFSVRKEPKPRGREQGVEGARITADDTVLLVDDVITTGGSTKKAYDRVVAIGATVVCVTPFVDRGDSGRALFEELGVTYRPLMTYRDLGIDPVIPG